MIKEDLTGKIFGKLTVLSRFEDPYVPSCRQQSKALWNCQCICGRNKIVSSNYLKNKKCKSCGHCSRGLLDETKSSKNNLYLVYRNSAKRRGLSFLLNYEKFMALTQQNCYYCGNPPNRYFIVPFARKGIYVNGIDRIDNNMGYEKNNSAPCCTDCNNAKNSLTKEEFLNWIIKCYNHLNSNNMFEGLK